MSEAKETASIEQNNDGSVKPRGEKGNGSTESHATSAVRRRLPVERHSLTHHFSVGTPQNLGGGRPGARRRHFHR
jgi:hypothetical protein